MPVKSYAVTNSFMSRVVLIGAGVVCTWLGMPSPAQSQTLTAGAPQQISNAKTGLSVDDASVRPVAAPNANMVAFSSFAENLDIADSDTNFAADIFLYNPAASPKLSRQSVTTNGEQTGKTLAEVPPASYAPAISPALPDGKYGIAFTSNA